MCLAREPNRFPPEGEGVLCPPLLCWAAQHALFHPSHLPVTSSCSSLRFRRTFILPSSRPTKEFRGSSCLAAVHSQGWAAMSSLSSEQREPPFQPSHVLGSLLSEVPSLLSFLAPPSHPDVPSKEKRKEIQTHTFQFSEICSLFGDQGRAAYSPPAQWGRGAWRNGTRTLP